MASVVTPATATVTIKESIRLNGMDFSHEVKYQPSGLIQGLRRIIPVQPITSGLTVFKPKVTALDTGSTHSFTGIESEKIEYLRLTNLDQEDSITIGLFNTGATISAYFRLAPKQSFLLTRPEIGNLPPTYENILNCYANTDGEAVNMEVVLLAS